MISPMDEYLVHQIAAPINQVASDHRQWQDRFYFNFIDPGKELSGILAMGNFPNMNLFQGVMNIAKGDKLICKNYFRPLGSDHHKIHAGSLRIEVKEPLKTWALKLSEPELEVGLDLDFMGRTPPFEFEKISWEREGQKVWDQCHYTQAGDFAGSLNVGGRKFKNLVGIRDRSWGIRDMARIDFWIWISANFEKYWLTAWLGQTGAGELINIDGAVCGRDGENDRIEAMDYEISFVPGRRTPASSVFLIRTGSGKELELKAKALHTIYVSVHSGILDLGREEVLAEKDKTTQVFDQTQVFELDGDTGLGMVEFFVMGGCSRYSETWRDTR